MPIAIVLIKRDVNPFPKLGEVNEILSPIINIVVTNPDGSSRTINNLLEPFTFEIPSSGV